MNIGKKKHRFLEHLFRQKRTRRWSVAERSRGEREGGKKSKIKHEL